MKHKIGIVTLKYDEKGNYISGEFEPEINIISIPDKLLNNIQLSESLSILADNANKVISSWFSKVTDIELNSTISSNNLECIRWPNGAIKSCSFVYYYEPTQVEQ